MAKEPSANTANFLSNVKIPLFAKSPPSKHAGGFTFQDKLFGRSFGQTAFDAVCTDVRSLRFAVQHNFLFLQVWFKSSFCSHVRVAIRTAGYRGLATHCTFIRHNSLPYYEINLAPIL